MKKITIYISIILTMFSVINVKAEEIQLTDYRYSYIKYMLDGYNLLYNDNEENVIVKPDGTLMYNSGEYYVNYTLMPRVQSGSKWWVPGNLVFPQLETGDLFVINNKNSSKIALINKKGEIIRDFECDTIYSMGVNYYCYLKDEIFNVVDVKTNECMASLRERPYLCEDDEKFMLITYIDENTKLVNLDFYNKDGKIFYSIENIYWDNFEESEYYDYENKCFYDNSGRKYRSLIEYEVINDQWSKYCDWSYVGGPVFCGTQDMYNFYKSTCRPASQRVDLSYTFKEKEIAGRIYYALFKTLSDDEDKQDYVSIEKPSLIYTKDIKNATKLGLLFNNSNCLYNEPITKSDCCVLLSEVFCKAEGFELDEYLAIKRIKYEDLPVNGNIYVAFCEYMGFIEKEPFFNVNIANKLDKSEELTQKELATMLKKADSTFNTQNLMLWSDKPCTREQAYSSIYKFYEFKVMARNYKSEMLFIPLGFVILGWLLFIAFLRKKEYLHK